MLCSVVCVGDTDCALLWEDSRIQAYSPVHNGPVPVNGAWEHLMMEARVASIDAASFHKAWSLPSTRRGALLAGGCWIAHALLYANDFALLYGVLFTTSGSQHTDVLSWCWLMGVSVGLLTSTIGVPVWVYHRDIATCQWATSNGGPFHTQFSVKSLSVHLPICLSVVGWFRYHR
jgi:hypothetical protein